MKKGLIGVQMMMFGAQVREMGAYDVLGKLAEKVIIRMNENEMDTLLANLKTVMEA